MPREMSPEEQERAKKWTARWKQKPVIYNAQYGRPRDVRTFIFDRSYILEDAVKNNNLVGKNDDDTMYRILMFVMKHLKYTGDEKTKGQKEFWQNPEDTVTLMKGDCEDGAILIKSLSLIAGIPDYKVRIAAGMVKGGGHAYVLYLRDDNTQCILDWCYWPNKKPIDARPKFADEKNYYDIWFSFNRNHTFAQQKRKYGPKTEVK
jgi:predicted transglutaminase-like cysteine proteinase